MKRAQLIYVLGGLQRCALDGSQPSQLVSKLSHLRFLGLRPILCPIASRVPSVAPPSIARRTISLDLKIEAREHVAVW